MKRKLFRTALWALVLTLLLPALAHADTGPKPSVRITFTGLGDRLCYGTLLSETKSTGPASVWNGDPADAYHKGNEEWADLDEATWRAFVDYQDSDGYHFLQWGWPVSDTDELAWTYYPPDRFKVLLYFPDDGSFISSGILESYAFHSYFTADIAGGALVSGKDQAASDAASAAIEVEARYDFRQDLLSLAARIAITLALELLLALAFGLGKRPCLLPIVAVNLVTQIALNAGLYLTAYYSGFYDFAITLFLCELLIFAVEAAALCLLLRRSEPRPTRGRIILYAACANTVSFVAGLFLSEVMPWLA